MMAGNNGDKISFAFWSSHDDVYTGATSFHLEVVQDSKDYLLVSRHL